MKRRDKVSSIKDRLMGVMTETVMISLLTVLLCVGMYLMTYTVYGSSTKQMMTLKNFYANLETVNRDVYTYTLEGDETVYDRITAACIEGRRMLRELTEAKAGVQFYRDVRDMQEMFYSYTLGINKIYDHSYLCDSLAIGSKGVINKYYNQTQEVYNAMVSEFQKLDGQLLEALDKWQIQQRKKNLFYLVELFVVVVVVLVHQRRGLRTEAGKVIRPVQLLTEHARAIGHKSLEQVEYVEQEPDADEEMRLLIAVYNSMIGRIQAQILTIQENASAKERLQVQELENLKIRNMLKESEMKALQMQINPHFLFNTLNMISQTAFLEHAEQTIQLLDNTAKLLRYTLDNTDKSVTLAKEVEIVGSYVELQEYRFGDRIQFEFELDEEFHRVQVPSMILQPLVENALTHGVGMKIKDARVVIRTIYDTANGLGIVEVEDNGEGMSQEKLSLVRAEMKKNQWNGKKIGLANIYMRLQIFFGNGADVELSSVPGESTCVRLLFPVEKETESKEEVTPDVSDNHCR